jgi:nicotinate (nicotinamide) nucleotide adenylyltransferase
MKETLGIFGGSFNPITYGHKVVIDAVLNSKTVQNLWLLPCAKSLYNKDLEHFDHRFKMCQLLCEDYGANIEASMWEDVRNKGSKTFDLMEMLEAEFPFYQLKFIIGGDNAHNVPNWYRGDEITDRFKFIIVQRGGIEDLPNWTENHDVITGEFASDISSTEFREKYKNGLPVDNIVHPDILDYIKQHNLYEG